MSKVSKTARASMAQTVGTKAVISDEVYIKNLRNDVNSGLYVAQEGAKALLRSYDAVLAENRKLAEEQDGAEAALGYKVLENEAQYKELLAANARVAELEAEIAKIKEVLSGPSATEVEAGNNHD